ncbi:uncharacterized protein LOC125315098 isoform X2 [Rhodamnia argentea]|uniref:Uncharacterized protein LOC125315098 isoform X2 n=1 Tax=Rhodamnia argentea TaxID=178133 RepID=A0ABM3HET0_9MYRT|nr:uncharacterized protein LOC125315098 isoform X2 [Rhodamnia argentea]
MDHHSLLWPESLGPRPDGIGYGHGDGAPMPNAAGAPPFPSSDHAPYAYPYRSGSPYGESYNFGDAEGQFYYHGHRPCDGDQSIDPWLLALMEDLRELYVRRRHTFRQMFPNLHGEIEQKLEEALRSKRTREVGAFQRSLSVGSPRLPGRDGGVGDEPALRLDRFKVRMVDLDDDVVGGGPQGGQGGAGGVASGGGGGKKGGK